MTGTIHSHRWHASSDAAPRECGIYILHGIGEHAGRYERVASLFTSLETGATPILFGHSLGGLVATSMVLDKHLAVSGLILSAPAYSPVISPFNKIRLKILKRLAPKFTQQLPYNAQNLTSDKQEQELGRNDPLNHNYKSAGIVEWIVRTGERMINSADTLQVPTLILIPGADAVIDSSQTKKFVEAAPTEHISVHYYEDYLHEVLNETLERREIALADIERWLVKHH